MIELFSWRRKRRTTTHANKTVNKTNKITSTATPAGRGLPHGLGQHQRARLRNQTAASSTVPRASNKPHHAPAGRRRSSCRRPLKKILLAHATLQGERLSARDALGAPKPGHNSSNPCHLQDYSPPMAQEVKDSPAPLAGPVPAVCLRGRRPRPKQCPLSLAPSMS